MEEERVLIINADGMLSALPTVTDYQNCSYVSEHMIVGKVMVETTLVGKIATVKSRVRVLSPDLPPPVKGENLFYLAIVNGVLKTV